MYIVGELPILVSGVLIDVLVHTGAACGFAWLITDFCCGGGMIVENSLLSVVCGAIAVDRLQFIPAPCMY